MSFNSTTRYRYSNRPSLAINDLPIRMELSKELAIFDINSKKKAKLSDYVCDKAKKTRLKILKRLAKSDRIANFISPMDRGKMAKFAENCPITDMSKFQEKAIRQRINAKILEERYFQLVNDIMKDTKEQFRKITYYSGTNLKFKEKVGDFSIENYKFLGKTDRFAQYLLTRKQFGKRWILHHELMKKFLDQCIATFPPQLFHVDIQKILEENEFKSYFNEKLKSSSVLLRNFHGRMSDLCENTLQNYLPACNGLFSIFVSESLSRTIVNVVAFTNFIGQKPYLKLFADFDGKLVLTPTEKQIIDEFYRIIDDLIAMAQNLNTIGKCRNENRKIFLCLTEEFIENCKKDVALNVAKCYGPIQIYLQKLETRFIDVYRDVICCENVDNSSDVLFENGFEKMRFYKNFIEKVAHIPNNEYFDIGQLDLSNYREKLHSKLRSISESIFRSLAAQHLWEVTDICDSYRLIEIRAEKKASTTEELIEIGKFMTWVRNGHLEELNERVRDSLKVLCDIITMGILDEGHVEKNSAALNWIEKISPIIERHTATFEQLKFEAEEKLQKEIEDINEVITNVYPLLAILDDMEDIKSSRNYLSQITLHMTKIKEIQRQIEWINNEEVCLNFPKSNYLEFDNLKDYVYPFYHLLKLCLEVQKNVSVWQYGQFDRLDYVSAKETVERFCKDLSEMQKMYRKKLRQAQDENLPIRFRGTVDDPDILNWPAPLKLCGIALDILEKFKPSLKIMKIMCNVTLRPRHWKAMSEIAGFDLTPNAGTTLKKMSELDLQNRLEEYQIISTCATKESQLFENLTELKLQWKFINFAIIIADNVTILDLEELENIRQKANEHSIKIDSMRNSVFVKPYQKEISKFSDDIHRISEFVDGWTIFQTAFLTLKPIFDNAKDIFKGKCDFDQCGKIFDKYLETIRISSSVMTVASSSDFIEELKIALKKMEEVQKCLDTHLEIIRTECPRLYLLSNKEALELIALKEIQRSFINKLFSAISYVNYDKNGNILSISSSFNEEIAFRTPIKTSHENVHSIITNLESELNKTLRYLTSECYKIFKKTPIETLVKKYPQQSLEIMANVFWTDQVQTALKLPHNIKLLLLKKKLQDNIEEKIDLVNNNNKAKNSEIVIYKNLLITDLNNKYRLESIMENGQIIDDNHFDWQKQLKYYFQNSLCTIQVLNDQIEYGFEYQGNFGQIFFNSMSDKFYLALLNAYFSNNFGAIKGASQTGKSCFIESLARALGKLFIMFDCRKTFSGDLLGRLFKFALFKNAWLSLENVDRLNSHVLSIISHELLQIIDEKCFVCVQYCFLESPISFKIRFRTFTLSKPDLSRILEGFLICEGVKEARNYSKKLSHCFEALENVLGNKFKLREIKLVVETYKKTFSLLPNLNFWQAFCLSIKKVFIESFSIDDQTIFEQTLSHLFRDDFLAFHLNEENEDFQFHLHSIANNIIVNSTFSGKVKSVFDCLNNKTRHLILLGDTFTGKTTALSVCRQLVENISKIAIFLHIINPHCLDYESLVGQKCENMNIRWIDGILSKIIRNVERTNWILFDCSIDETWAMDLVSLMENGKLHLETMEIIKSDSESRFIFETCNLDSCSPSMISNCTVIYFPRGNIRHAALVDAWIKTCQSDWLQDHQIQIEALLKWILTACLETTKPTAENALANNLITYFELILNEANASLSKKEEIDPKNAISWIQASLMQAGLTTFGNLMEKEAFDDFYKRLWKGQNENYPYPALMEKLEVVIPSEGVLCDYCYIYKQRGNWKLWTDLAKNEKALDRYIPTADMAKLNYFANLHLKNKKNLLIIGPRCSGKTSLIENWFKNSPNDDNKLLITIKNRLKPDEFRKLLSQEIGRDFACFIDDLHCSSNGAVELFKMHLDHGFWYGDNLERIFLDNINFIVTAHENNELSRLYRHFNLLFTENISKEALTRIYTQQLSAVWKKHGFPSDMLNMVNQIVDASLNIYFRTKETLKLTFGKWHCAFDLNSLAKIMRGLTLLKKEVYDGNKRIIVKLWTHELLRTLGDPLFSDDFSQLKSRLSQSLQDNFPDDFQDVCLERIYFGSFCNNKRYEEVNFPDFKSVCVQRLLEYNAQFSVKLDLLFFDYALEMLAKLCRLLTLPDEHALLIGGMDVGKKALTKFASFLCEKEFFQPEIVNGDNNNNKKWMEDWKFTIKACGGLNRKFTFFSGEAELLNLLNEEGFDILDHYARQGDVTDLFDLNEKRDLLEVSRLSAQGGNKNLEISARQVFLHFNKTCRENLHLVLSISFDTKWRSSMQKFVKNFNVIFWQDWPDEALNHVSNHWINPLNLDQQIKEKVAEASIHFYKTYQERCFATPKSFIHFHELYSDLIDKKQQKLKADLNNFQRGLAKLSYAAKQIEEMQKSLADYQPLLEQMTKNAKEMTEQIALETLEVEKASALVRKEEKTAGQQASVAQVLKSECEAELAQAIPILEDAISALNTLKPSDITLVKSMKNPPDAIKLVMASVCVMKEVKPDRIPDPSTGRKTLDYWGPSKRILGDMNFLQTLKDFDKDRIRPEVILKIRKDYLPHKDFKPHVVAKASGAAEGLCKWIIAMDMYDRVAKEVAPKKEKLRKAEKEYAETVLVLNEKMEEVARIEQKLAQLNRSLHEANKKQLKLQVDVDLCNRKLQCAQKLIGSLGGEKRKWGEASERLQKHYQLLTGDILISASIIAYLSALNKPQRTKIINQWTDYIRNQNIPHRSRESFKISTILSDETEIDYWQENSLPPEEIFLENAVISTHSKLVCLFLDPHRVALEWILNMESNNNVSTTKFTFKNWLGKLSNCLLLGGVLIIEDTEDRWPACINSFICQENFAENDETFTKINGQMVKINPKSRIYLISSRPSVQRHFQQIRSKLTIINFALTHSALENKCLQTLVEIERPEIRKMSEKLAENVKRNKIELKQLETKILSTLCDSEIDILEDHRSIAILDESKRLSKIAEEKQEETAKISKTIQEFKENYLEVSKYVANLFFHLEQIKKLNKFYQFSLKWFENVYFLSILNSRKSKDLKTRCRHLRDDITFELFKNISKTLFRQHKQVFAFWLAISGKNYEEELPILFSKNDVIVCKEIFEQKLSYLQQLERLPCFKNVTNLFRENETKCFDYYYCSDKISGFQKLLLTKALRPRNFLKEISNFVEATLGNRFLEPIFFDMQQTFNESYNLMPIIFLTTSEVDLLSVLKNFAKVKRFEHKFLYLSLSSDERVLGQAEKWLFQARNDGFWLLFDNCHLADEWLYRLEEIMRAENASENFRLFLATENAEKLPADLMKNSIKILEQYSDNLKWDLRKIYHKPLIAFEDYYNGCPGKQEVFSKLLYKLCRFHFLLNEKQHFNNWHLPYKLEESLLLSAQQLLQNFVNQGCYVFEKTYYIIGECLYNAHLTEDYEKVFLLTMLKSCINDQLSLKSIVKTDKKDFIDYIMKLPEKTFLEYLYLSPEDVAESHLIGAKDFLNFANTLWQNNLPNFEATRENALLTIIEELLTIFPNPINQTTKNGLLKKEISLYNLLLDGIKSDLNDLKVALNGEFCNLSENLERIAESLLKNRVPDSWLKRCFPTSNFLAKFSRNIQENVDFLIDYIDDPNRPVLLRALYFPRAVLCDLRLKFAKIEFENSCLEFEFIKEYFNVNESCLVLRNLFILSANYDFNTKSLTESDNLINPLPLLLIKPALINDFSRHFCKLNVFRTRFLNDTKIGLKNTANFITEIRLKCLESDDFWIKRGVHIVCEI